MAGIIQKQTAAAAAAPEKKTMQQYIKSMESEIKKALPSVITPERFTRIVLSAISVNPQLGQCTPQSFLGAMMTSAQLGLEVNTPLGQAYVLPYRNKGVLEAQFQLGYKGLIDLAYRSGEVEVIQAHVVYENDEFTCEYGLDPKLTHKPADSNRGNPIKVYAVFKTKSGGFGFEVMSMEDVRKHAEKYSKAYSGSFSPWKTSFEEMAKKTVLKRVLKYAPLKSDFVRAAVQDEVIKKDISDDMYSVPDENIIEAEFSDVIVGESTGEIIEGEAV
jgi:recombination protein RecT